MILKPPSVIYLSLCSYIFKLCKPLCGVVTRRRQVSIRDIHNSRLVVALIEDTITHSRRNLFREKVKSNDKDSIISRKTIMAGELFFLFFFLFFFNASRKKLVTCFLLLAYHQRLRIDFNRIERH